MKIEMKSMCPKPHISFHTDAKLILVWQTSNTICNSHNFLRKENPGNGRKPTNLITD